MKKILGVLAVVLMIGACANTLGEESSVEEQSKEEITSSELEQSAKDESFEAQLRYLGKRAVKHEDYSSFNMVAKLWKEKGK